MHDTMTLQSSRSNMFKHVDHKKCRISSDLIIVKLDNSSQFEHVVTAFKALSHIFKQTHCQQTSHCTDNDIYSSIK